MNCFKYMLLAAAMLFVAPKVTAAQQTTSRPDPDARDRIVAQVRASGLTSTQIRARLRALGFQESVIDQVLGIASDTTTMTEDFFIAARALGVRDTTVSDTTKPGSRRRTPEEARLLETLGEAVKNDTLRNAIQMLLNEKYNVQKVGGDSGFNVFGREVFEEKTTQFEPAIAGPLPPDYRIGSGDKFTIALTGEVEKTQDVTVTGDGSVFLAGVGQVTAANLTFDQFRNLVTSKLATIQSGIERGRVRVVVLPTAVGTSQVFVLGDVRAPGAYQVSRLGTVLTALYAAGGPSEEGNGRAIDVKRDGRVIATMDLYDYLLTGSAKSDIRMNNGDIVFVRPRGARVRVTGAVVRPATYEVNPGETIGDAIRMAGGFLPEAERRRLQIERVIPAGDRQRVGSDKEVIDITSPTLATPLESGDVVRVYRIADHIANEIEVQGLGVWHPTRIAYSEDMRLSQAIEAAGGIRPEAYLGAVQVSRLQRDSTRIMTRVGLRSDGTPTDDITLTPHDIVTVYSTTEFRTQRFVKVGGAVRKPTEIPYQEGMTLRDAIMAAGGLEESALLEHAEIARLPENRANGVTATTIAVSLDSTYLFERGPDGKYHGPPGLPVPNVRVPEVRLQPYDAVSILRQPDFEYQRTVIISGRVKFPTTYSLTSKTERLSDLIARAGGLAADADSSAIVFMRMRDSTGRIGVNLPRVLKNPSDIDNLVLVDKDSIHIPAYNPIVMVRGEVNSRATAVAYVKGADIDYYISSAGGGTAMADKRRAYVLQPSGKVQTKHRTLWVFHSDPKPQPGATVQVPRASGNPGFNWSGMAQASLSLLGSLVTAAALIKALRE